MAGYGERHEEFRDEGIRVVALTAEDEGGARKMKEAEGLDFDILYGLDVDEMEERIGAYVEKGGEREHLQPAQFILKPDGTVALASYSSGPVGRLDAEEALEETREAMEKEEEGE